MEAQRGLQGENTEMYLKVIRELAADRAFVPVTGLAKALGISTVSASEKVGRLQDMGLLVHRPYKGVRLTGEGERKANLIVRRHRLWERFLVDELDVPWSQAHDLACQLEHISDPALTKRLAARLGKPDRCPHGNPIPTEDGRTMSVSDSNLASIPAGSRAVVRRIYPEDGELLMELERLGLLPGREILLTDAGPQGGEQTLEVGGKARRLRRRAAERVRVNMEADA